MDGRYLAKQAQPLIDWLDQKVFDAAHRGVSGDQSPPVAQNFRNGHGGVHIDSYPLRHTGPVNCEERRARALYLSGLRVPYYLYIGRKPAL
jgi:hypothetical protein